MTKQSVMILMAACSALMTAACSNASKSMPWRMSAYDAGAPVIQYGATDGYGSSGVHTVMSGENLTAIARHYRVAPQDLIAVNDLQPPYRVHPGQRLKITTPATYQVKAGDSLISVARTFSVPQGSLIAENNIAPPYQLRIGQKLHLPPAADVSLYATAQSPVVAVPMWEAAPVQNPIYRETLSPIAEQKPMPQPTVQVASLGSGMMVLPRTKPVVTPVSTRNEMVAWPPMKETGRPFLVPLQGKVLSSYGSKSDGRYNEGINIAAKLGAPVRAARDGQIVYVGNAVEGYGNLILIKHDGEYITAYAHLDKTFVKDGAKVKRGQVIGTVGATGNVDRAQLHFEIRKGRKSLDPVSKI